MNPIERAVAHFKAQQIEPIEVPEWRDEDGTPTLIYANPINLRERQQIRRVSDQVGGVEAMANVLILRALDAQGKPMFTLADKQRLVTQVDPDVLSRVVIALTAAPSAEEQQKN